MNSDFKTGASDAAEWFRDRVKIMADEGKSAREIADHLDDLHNVIMDWKEGVQQNGEDWSMAHPWMMPPEELRGYIEASKEAW
jgi:transposase